MYLMSDLAKECKISTAKHSDVQISYMDGEDMKELPGVIGKWEFEVEQYQQRTGETFPEIMRLPILFSMVPKGWKKEIETK